jgi:hypothetical protein
MEWVNVIESLRGKEGIEFGGTTELFYEPRNNMMLYPFVKLDGANIFDDNHFNDLSGYDFNYFYGVGKRYNVDASDEEGIKNINKKYDFIVTSHVIEHMANPIKSIELWKKHILNDGGYILTIIPYYKECFDRNRPLTTIEHLIEDYQNNVDESDTTHINEQKELHDWTMGGHKDFYSICDINHKTRVVHHHTFDLENIKQMFEYCNMEIVYLFKHDPLNIVVLTKIK